MSSRKLIAEVAHGAYCVEYVYSYILVIVQGRFFANSQISMQGMSTLVTIQAKFINTDELCSFGWLAENAQINLWALFRRQVPDEPVRMIQVPLQRTADYIWPLFCL